LAKDVEYFCAPNKSKNSELNRIISFKHKDQLLIIGDIYLVGFDIKTLLKSDRREDPLKLQF